MDLNHTRYILGLDLGTANVRVYRASYVSGRIVGAPQPAALLYAQDGAVPAVIQVDRQGRNVRAYGRPALDKLAASQSEEGFVFDFKPSVGQSPEDLVSPIRPGSLDFRWTREEALKWTEALLARLLEDLEARVFGQALTAENGWGIVASVPDAWGQPTRQLLQGLLARRLHNDNVEIVSDTEAALAFHAAGRVLESESLSSSLLVVHIGAGYTRVVRVRGMVDQDKVQVRALRSYTERYGGLDFDQVFGRYIARAIGVDPEPLTHMVLQRARKLKEEFSMSAEIGYWQLDTAVDLPGMSGPVPISFGRASFESDELAGNLIRKFPRLIGRSLQALNLDRNKVSGIVVVGGGASWYFVQDTLRRLFPAVPVLVGAAPQIVVALGTVLAPSHLDSTAVASGREDLKPLLMAGRNAEVEKRARERLEWDPGDLEAGAVFGYALLRLGRKDQARQSLAKAIQGASRSPSQVEKVALSLAYAGLGWLERDAGRFQEALTEYERALDLDQDNVLAHVGIGFVLQCADRPTEAEMAYRSALAVDPSSASALRYLGKLYLDAHRFAEAETIFRKLLASDTPDLMVLFSLGAACAGQNKQEEAERWFREAIACDPDHAPSYAALGSLYRAAGRTAEAEEALGRAVAIDPANALVHHNLAALYSALGRHDSAIAAYQRTVELNPRDAIAFCSLGILLVRQNHDAGAEKAFRQALALDPTMVKAGYGLARLYHRANRYAEAASQYDAVLKIAPEMANAARYRADALQHLKKK